MTANHLIDGGYVCASREHWSEAFLRANYHTSRIQLTRDTSNNPYFTINNQGGGTLFYLIPVGNAEHPDLWIHTCWYTVIATRDENGTLLYLKFDADPASGTGKVVATPHPDRYCVFQKARDMLDKNSNANIVLRDDRNIAMHLHYQQAQNVLLFKERDATSSETEMFWAAEFKVVRGKPSKKKNIVKALLVEVAKEVGMSLFMSALGL